MEIERSPQKKQIVTETLNRAYTTTASQFLNVFRRNPPAETQYTPTKIDVEGIISRILRGGSELNQAMYLVRKRLPTLSIENHSSGVVKNIDDAIGLLRNEGTISMMEAQQLRIELERRKTEVALAAIPETHRKEVKDFVKQILAVIPEDFLDTHIISSRMHLRAIFAASYLVITEKGEIPNKAMYIRALLATDVSEGQVSLQNQAGNSHDVAVSFLSAQTPLTKETLSLFLVQFIATTMPVSERPHNQEALQEKFEVYNQFFDRVIVYIRAGFDQLRISLRNFRDGNIRVNENVVFVGEIHRRVPLLLGGDPVAATAELYDGLKASAITEGVDTVTGLEVSAIWYNEQKVTTSSQGPLRRDEAHRLASNQVHEQLHSIGPVEKGMTDWENLINEMLTESANLEIMLTVQGQSLATMERYGNFDIVSSYGALVYFMKSLLEQGLVTRSELIELAAEQKPHRFMELLTERTPDTEAAKAIVTSLIKGVLIDPAFAADIDQAVQDFIADPKAFLERNMIELANRMGLSIYLSTQNKKYQLAMLEEIQKVDRDYLPRMGSAHGLEPDQTDLVLLKDPATGLFTKEAQTAFAAIFQKVEDEDPPIIRGFVKREFLLNKLQPPLEVDFDQFTPKEIQRIILIINYALGIRGFYNPDLIPHIDIPRDTPSDIAEQQRIPAREARYNLLIETSKVIVPRLQKVLAEKWKGIAYTNDHLLGLLGAAAYGLNQIHIPTILYGGAQEAAEIILQQIEAILTEVRTDSGQPVVTSPAIAHHYIRVADIASPEDSYELENTRGKQWEDEL